MFPFVAVVLPQVIPPLLPRNPTGVGVGVGVRVGVGVAVGVGVSVGVGVRVGVG